MSTINIHKSDFYIDDAAAAFLPRRPIATDVTTDVVKLTMKSWILDCHQNHHRCYHNKTSLLPTRVIDVGIDVNAKSVKLHVSCPRETGQYVALSYCWGSTQCFITTIGSLNEMLSTMPIEILSKTVQDAIETTRDLGYRYLWVDALCIIQDDESDKLREISNMSAIYKDAAVTIAAASASSSHEGFLRVRRNLQPLSRACTVKAHLLNGRVGFIQVASFYDFHLNLEHNLDHRAWSLQEFLLSPRLLVYSDFEVLWYCEVEAHKTVTKSNVEYIQGLRRIPLRRKAAEEHQPVMSVDEQYKTWKNIIEEYTGRSLSDPEDRLHALAGVSSELEGLWMDNYSYGLWQNNLVKLLAWRPETNLPRRSNRAPSWSWASFDCPIRFDVLSSVHAWLVIDSGMCFEGSDRMKIRLTCNITSIKVRHMYYDVVEEEDTYNRVHLLSLGCSVKGGLDVGLVVFQIGPDTYRRVGYFESPSGLEMSVEKTVVLV